jgi:hypothetical protein
MASVKVGAYCWEALGPDKINDKYISDIQQSALDTVMLFAVHIGNPKIPKPGSQYKYGDLVFNNPGDLFVSAGEFNPENKPQIANWPAQIARLKQGNSKVTRIFFCVGGWAVQDYPTIKYMLTNGMGDKLKENFAELKRVFTPPGAKECSIDGFDIDFEEASMDRKIVVAFCKILFNLGFAVTFGTFADPTFWRDCMKELLDAGRVSWWNLQCYNGGSRNRDPKNKVLKDDWIKALSDVVGKSDAPSLLLPGLAVKGSGSYGLCPDGPGGFRPTFEGWNALGLGGGWLWRYDDILANKEPCSGPADLAAYVKAIRDGLTKPK